SEVCSRQPAQAANLPDWPGSPDGIGRAVKRLAGPLKDAHKIEYVAGVRDKDRNRTRLIVLRTVSEASEASTGGATPTSSSTSRPAASADGSARGGTGVRTAGGTDTRQPQAPEDVSGGEGVAPQDVAGSAGASDTSDAGSGGEEMEDDVL